MGRNKRERRREKGEGLKKGERDGKSEEEGGYNGNGSSGRVRLRHGKGDRDER